MVVRISLHSSIASTCNVGTESGLSKTLQVRVLSFNRWHHLTKDVYLPSVSASYGHNAVGGKQYGSHQL